MRFGDHAPRGAGAPFPRSPVHSLPPLCSFLLFPFSLAVTNYFLLENQLAKFSRIGTAPPYQISDWYGVRPTWHTASGATAFDSRLRFSCNGYDDVYSPQSLQSLGHLSRTN